MLPGWPGYGGVGMSGVHAASRSVASLPSVWASRMAVTGRQNPYRNLPVNDVISAS